MAKKKIIETPATQLEPEVPQELTEIGQVDVATKTLKVERVVDGSAPTATKWPNVRGGICEFCGILDSKVPSHLQYTLCPHYQGLKDLQCTYCPEGTDIEDVRKHRLFRIYESPPNSGKFTVVCDDMRCETTHLKRFQVKRTI